MSTASIKSPAPEPLYAQLVPESEARELLA